MSLLRSLVQRSSGKPSTESRSEHTGRWALVMATLLVFAVASVAVASPAVQTAPSGNPAELEGESGSVRNGEIPSPSGRYIVRLWERPLATYDGGIAGYAGTSMAATGATDVELDTPQSVAYLAYLTERQNAVLAGINEALGRDDVTIVRTYQPEGVDKPVQPEEFRYRATFNGFAIHLSDPGTAAPAAQLEAIARVPGVMTVEPDVMRELVTDVGPEWIGAPEVWGLPTQEDFDALDPENQAADDATPDNGVPCTEPTGPAAGGHCGEMMVVGIIDTGVNPYHESFADPGPVTDYSYAAGAAANANPNSLTSDYYGVCSELGYIVFGCNDKLLGMYDFTVPEPGAPFPDDVNGHGSHVASTTAGNVVNASLAGPTIDIPRRISGVAPHAHIISYKVCQTTIPAGCLLTALALAIETAALDDVDVINFSIGGGPSDPWADVDSIAFRDAVFMGTYAAVAAGNSGPNRATMGSPADAPWVAATAALTHDRTFENGLINMGPTGQNPPGAMLGKSITCGYPQEEFDPQDEPIDWETTSCPGDIADSEPEGTAPLVWAGDYESDPEGDCGAGTANPTTGVGTGDPFPSSVDFDGAIVVCIRGIYGRVAKGVEVAENGAGGMVLINDEASGDSLIADPHVLPAVHLTYSDGQELLAWLETAVNPVGAIQGTSVVEDADIADITASFSSRGPSVPVPGVLKPDVGAPGVDIFAAWFDSDNDADTHEYNVISGTSMASPHHAGAATLVRALHPDWTPDQVRSALMTTSFDFMDGDGNETHSVLKDDGATLADPFDRGAGRVNLIYAPYAGFVLDETESNYIAADPNNGGDPTALNLASMSNGACDATCSWTRRLQSTQTTPVTWTVTVSSDPGMTLSIDSDPTLTLPAAADVTASQVGEPGELTITATITDESIVDWMFGRVTLTPDDPTIPVAHFPVSVLNANAILPGVPLHFHGNTHDGDEQTGGNGGPCTGNGSADLAACGGAFLSEDPELDTEPAARWIAASPVVDGTAPQNLYDPNWIWRVSEPTTVRGAMTINWWTSCSGCGIFADDWEINFWADDGILDAEGNPAPNHSVTVTTSGATPNVPTFVSAVVVLPELTAQTSFVLQIDPIYIDTENATVIYYDGQSGCLAIQTGPCDSFVLMPIVGQQQPTPTPTLTTAPTDAPTDVPTIAPTVDPTIEPTLGPTVDPSPTHVPPTEAPTTAPTTAPTATPTRSPGMGFIPDTAYWAISTPEGLVTTSSLLILLGSGAVLAAPAVRRWLRSRRLTGG